MLNTFPLVTRALNAPIAYLTKPIENLGLAPGKVDTQTFLSHVNMVAAILDKRTYAINLC
jgi:hypothetical protein